MTIRQNIFRQIFEASVSVKISPVKILRYMVAIVQTIIPGISIWSKVASITGANYCPDTFVVRRLLTIMFTQRSSCIGRSQV